MHQQLVTAFANSFTDGENFTTIVNARSLAGEILNQKIEPGTPLAKLVDESVEQGLILAARQLVGQSPDPLQAWAQCLDLYDRQPALNTRTSTSILQQAYSTPVPIAFLAAKLAGIDRETSVYEPTAGNGALLLLANPSKAIVNELNSDRAAALRAQGFQVTQQDASSFIPATEAVDRIITNPPFGSLKDAQGQTRMFRRGRLTTSQLDHAIALSALDLMKADGKAVLILGGKTGDEVSRQERYNTQLTRGFYRWLYKDTGYKVADHFSLAGSLYRKQGTSFPIDVILIEGRGETQLKLPGVEPPRVYASYESLREVLIHATQQQQSIESSRDTGTTLPDIHARSSLDTNVPDRPHAAIDLDNSIASRTIEPNKERRGILISPDAALGMVDRGMDRRRDDELRPGGGLGNQIVDSTGNRTISSSTSAIPQPLSNAQGDGILRNNELLGLATSSLEQSTVSSDSSPRVGVRLGSSQRDESEGLVGLDEYGRESTLLSRLSNMAKPLQIPEADEVTGREQNIENQVVYKPRSKAVQG